ncbi:TQXA domain-containing protein [Mycobacterium shinjukuense]|uniref:TQXA domain-containing protein n=1 Tax=Mycobacterium shinjukuense TaxID=398694 RepID=A0A7I7MMI2_9MYCO|nr:TQXA domain-containing protein [Mycobacterium shinjukuense]MCV6986628.1 TQXA domain-containing protein [Mycobacterium shinjukuense]ORB64054.1 TQXA domain-containing protein [Mycobacterium shinjukuense]BBX72967.1 TQXA domain-containing protein [Mycobacterium shinjukuense]
MTVLSTPRRTRAPVATSRRILARPVTELTRMTRYQGGTYSHTVDRIVFADGSSAHTDLIKLNPNLQAYSLDFHGTAPDQPSLRHSFPTRSTAQLSQQLRDAGYPLGPANISEHEAIAGTQAAIWYLTNGLALDTQPLNVPVGMRRSHGAAITFEFDGHPQLGGYSLQTQSITAVDVKLQKSVDGLGWQDISGSQLTTRPGRGRYRRTLGVGSTLSASSHGNRGRGYRYYRLIATTPDGSTPTIDDVGFWLTGSRHYRNADRVVHLYNYLLAGAEQAVRKTEEPRLIPTDATAESDLIGPFRVRIPLRLSAGAGHAIVDVDGRAIDSTVHPGIDFYLRRAPGTSAITLTATTPRPIGGRVLTGVASDGSPHRFTPVALTVPTDVIIEFDISWDEAWSDILREGR